MLEAGSVVVVAFPGAVKTKVRPVIVVSTDLYHKARPDVIVALLTTNVTLAVLPTDYVLQDWAAAGLHKPSAFRAFLMTQPVADIQNEVGKLTDRDWAEVQARLRLAVATL